MKVGKKFLGVILSVVMIISIIPFGAVSAVGGQNMTKISDDTTLRGQNAFQTSTAYNGKVWTNKGVSADGNFSATGLSSNVSISTKEDEFAVALSALAQSYSQENAASQKKANIVFTIDVSSSMRSNYLNGLSRLEILKTVANNFISSLSQLGSQANYQINMAIVFYAGQGYIKKTWTAVNSTTLSSLQSVINSAAQPGSDVGNTNSQAGAYLARLLYSDEYATTYGRPSDYADTDTNNFVLFMTDGAPNKYYVTGTSAIDSIPLTSNKMSTANSGITRNITNTDYKKMAAYKLLEQADGYRENINNITTFSLGLGEWFTKTSAESGFSTATYLLQLFAACANSRVNPVDGASVTADYCWNHYLGYDVPDGTMPYYNPTFPDMTPSAGNFLQSDGTYKYKFIGNSYTFATFEDMINSLNGVAGASRPKSDFIIPVNDRTVDATYGTLAECGIPTVNPELLSQIAYYYAGNSAEQFQDSIDDINSVIINTISGQVTAVEDDPSISGYVTMYDTFGSDMEFRHFEGVEFDGTLYNSSSFAYACINQTQQALAQIASMQKYFSKNYGTLYTTQAMTTVIQGCINAGTLYYNSDTDYKAEMKWYASYNSTIGGYAYVAPYFNADGTLATRPANAQYIMTQFAVNADLTSSLLLKGSASTMYLYMAVAQNISTGTQTMICKVPANLLPTRQITVSNETAHLTTGNSWPISIFYKVGVKSNITDDELASHLITNADGTQAYQFFSNAWKSQADLAQSYIGTTYSTFTANIDNPYYRNQENKSLYVRNDSSYERATSTSEGPYYIATAWVTDGTSGNDLEANYGLVSHYYQDSDIVNVADVSSGVVYKYVVAGAVRKSPIEYDMEKGDTSVGNATGTNPYYYQPSFVKNSSGEVVATILMGNNGKLTISKQSIAMADSVVLDYGLDTKINVLSNDVFPTGATNTTVTNVASIDDQLNDGLIYTESKINNTSKSVALTNGTLSVNTTDNDLVFDLTSSDFSTANKAFYECSYQLSGVTYYCYGIVTIMPANNIYYEQDFCTLSSDWTQQGTVLSTYQNGTDSYVHGFDPAYSTSNNHSNGTAVKTTVTNAQYQAGLTSGSVTWPSATFTFYGTAFDVISYTGANTGLMTVTVTNLDTSATVKNIAVNTHYSSRVGETTNGNYGDLYQIPVITYNIGTYGHYQLTIKAAYHPYFDLTASATQSSAKSVLALNGASPISQNSKLVSALAQMFSDTSAGIEYYTVEDGKVADTESINTSTIQKSLVANTANASNGTATALKSSGQYDVYLDAIRVYNPAGVSLTSGDIFNAYTTQHELNPNFVKLRDMLIETETEDPGFIIENGANGAMYVEQYVQNTYDDQGNITQSVTSGGSSTIKVSTYAKNGPNDEVYLEYGNAVAFRISNYTTPCYVQVSAKTPTYQDAILAVNGNVVATVGSATEMYFDISQYVSSNGTIVLSNLGQGILSLCNVKIVAGSNNANTSSLVSDSVTMDTVNTVLTSSTIKAPALTDKLNYSVKLNAAENGTTDTYTQDIAIDSSKFTYALDSDNNWYVTFDTPEYTEFLNSIVENKYNGSKITYNGPEDLHFSAEYDKTTGKWTVNGIELNYSVVTPTKPNDPSDDNNNTSVIKKIIESIVKFIKSLFTIFS